MRSALGRKGSLFRYVLLVLLGVFWTLPLWYIVLTSLRAEKGAYKSYIWPREFTLQNYSNLWTGNETIAFGRWFLNTLSIAVCTMILSTVFLVCVAYSMSRLRFRLRKSFLNLSLIIGLFPGFMSMIAVYYILKGLGLLETGLLKQFSLVMVYSAGSGLGFYIAKGYFDTIPRSIDEASYMDGASKLDTFIHIILPASKPIITYTMITSFLGPWVDFIFAKVILGNDSDYYTVAIGLWMMLEKEYIEYYYTQFFAGSVMVSVPITVLFLLTQKFYVEGLAGAVKG